MSTRPGSGGRAAGGGPASKVCQFKLVLLGESAVGKSSLVLRFVKGQFHEFQESTIGAAFLTQTVCLDEATVKFEIWDTAGQERYHSLAPMYYRGAQAAVVVYDISNADSFAKAKSWVKELQRQASPNIVIALAGNKADLANKRVVEYEVRWETRVLHPLIDLSLGCVRPPPPHEHVPPLQQWTCGDSLACVARRHRQLLLHFDRYQHLLPLTHGKLLESLQPGGVDFEKLAAEWTKRFAA